MQAERRSAVEVTDGLMTKADKIRALDKAGYSRAEIARFLGIRYQHVRQVLVRSEGRDFSKPRNSQQPAEPFVPLLSVADLLLSGFSRAGSWKLDFAGEIQLEGKAPTEPGVYAFILNGQTVYVGVTLRSLLGRFDQYRRGHIRQRTSHRINGQIKSALAEGAIIEVIVATPESGEWNGLPVSTASGLEVALIQAIRPRWNIQVGRASKARAQSASA